ncbi:MAG: hypothetical protein EOP49_08660 [Sphingobacteriales bacterium]|nr:MAG: hypothetical protein EOP49_08660 [Sphingobacteriales bacterium]
MQVNLEQYQINLPRGNIFICLVLDSYFDASSNRIDPEKDFTALKFQASLRSDYYSKTYDLTEKKVGDYFLNINEMVTKDFQDQFSKKPHSSNLIAPAIILYAIKRE